MPLDLCTKAGATDLTLAETYQMDYYHKETTVGEDGSVTEMGEWLPLPGDPSDQLQMCPWFLEWYKAETYQVRPPKDMIGSVSN